MGGCPFDELGDPRVVEADEGGHAPLASGAGRLHQLAAATDEADGIAEVEGAGGDEGRVLAHRVAGREGGFGGIDAELAPAGANGGEVGDARGEERGLRVLGAVEVLLGTLPCEPGDRLAERLVGGSEHGGGVGRGFGEGAAHADGLAPLPGEHEGDLAHRPSA